LITEHGGSFTGVTDRAELVRKATDAAGAHNQAIDKAGRAPAGGNGLRRGFLVPAEKVKSTGITQNVAS
jgi:hypothetical protein